MTKTADFLDCCGGEQLVRHNAVLRMQRDCWGSSQFCEQAAGGFHARPHSFDVTNAGFGE